MSAHVSFRSRSSIQIPEAEIRQRLSHILTDTDIAISLTTDQSENPVEAEVEIPMGTNTRYIVLLFNTFWDMGWDS